MRIKKIFLWIISILVPFFLIISSVRILLNPWFLRYEYNRPDFPQDVYGFSLQDRTQWGNISLEYLVNNSDISFLADQNLADGHPLYNARELKHMVDVKSIVQIFIIVWYILLAILLLALLWFWRKQEIRSYFLALSRGGWLTIGLIGAVLVYLLINFDALFTQFHHIFFEGDTWLFSPSDTLIRLFPIPLWQDAFIFVGIFSAIMSLILGGAGIIISRKQKNRTAG